MSSLHRHDFKMDTNQKNAVYLDYNATTPVAQPVKEAVDFALSYLWGNPSSGHRIGRLSRASVEAAREKVALLIGAQAEEIIFTSGGTESNNMVLLGLAGDLSQRGKHLITSKIEHPSVMNPCLHLLEKGWDITFVGVDQNGLIKIEEIDSALRPDTVLVSIMLANNETGVIQPLDKVAELLHGRGVLLHADGAQAVGKIPIDTNVLKVDYLTVAGHKLYAPKGIGALFCRKGAPVPRLLSGAGQERGIRPGTEPVPLAVGLGKACEFVAQDLEQEAKRQHDLREELFTLLKRTGHRIIRFGGPENTLPNTLNISFPGKVGSQVLENAPGLMASTGAACHDRSIKISHVIAAMDVPKRVAIGAIRLSLGRFTTRTDITLAAKAISSALGRP